MMPISSDDQVFGPKDDPLAQVGLPFDLIGRMLHLSPKNTKPDTMIANTDRVAAGKCGLYFACHGGLQKRTWHDLWEAAVAIWGICGRIKKQGFAFIGSKYSVGFE